jgi:hypothetical protein
MTPSQLAIGLSLLMICTGIVSADTFTPAVSARDPGVPHSISYEILGPRNHPFPIVYLSTRHFGTKLGEFLVVLPKTRFDILSAYTRARIARPDCPGAEPVGDVWYTVKITEHDKKRTRGCVLLQALACDYLSGVVKLSDVNWTAEELRPITNFMGEVGCGNVRGR